MASQCFLRYQFPWLEHPIVNILSFDFSVRGRAFGRGYEFSNTKKPIIWKALAL
jgi:hypothetical protein